MSERERPPLRLLYVADPRSIHTVRWIRFFAARGHEIALASPHAPPADLGLEAHYSLSQHGAAPGTRVLLNALQLRRAIRAFRPQILHAHYINECGWLGALSGFHPFVLTAWGSDVYVAPRISRLARLLSPWAVRRSDFVTADSTDQVRQLVAMGAREDSARVVGWGVDLDRFGLVDGTVWRGRLGVDAGRPIILSPRQWIPNSNILLIIEAFARLLRVRPDAILVLKRTASTPNQLAIELEARLASLGVLEATRIVGEVPEQELPGLYAAADITVSVCSSDGTPVSMLEAMASRSALVVGDLPSLREWIRHGENGILVPVGDVERLAAELRRLVEDAELCKALGHEGRRTVEERADRKRHLESMERIYRGLAHPQLREVAPEF